MISRDPESLRSELRAILVQIGTGAPFSDADDVFDRGVVRSINLIELITLIEDTYGVEIAQRDVFEGHLRSIDSLATFVHHRAGVRS